MKKCASCGSRELEATTERQIITGAGRKFTATLPAVRCKTCGETYTEAAAHTAVERRAAALVARSGEVTGETFRFLRHALGLRAIDVASMFAVAPETVSRWETGSREVDRLAWTTLATMAIDRAAGEVHTTTEVVLEAVRAPRPLAKAVKVPNNDGEQGAAE